ncbi:MAG TPA: CYTH and CHAD domain-containing protein, partial [Candidatus Dormibacteraeota bacterium]|nr:CYTH and CHAD domain-containing protein [Candidatus Dormibacteraeota bacterium]
EREVKLAAPPGFRLLDLGGIADDVVATSGEERRLTTVYWDTPDLRLVRWGCSLRHRAGEGWTVKLPDDGDGTMLVRQEHHFDGPATHPPQDAVRLLLGYVRHAPLAPVARLQTVRKVVALLSDDGQRLVEIDDDEVTVYQGRRVASRFREVEVEAAEGTSDSLIEAVLERLHAGGAGKPDPTPKLVRALGSMATEPPEVSPETLDAHATAGDLARRAFAASVARLLRHDPGVRVGGDPEEVHQARVATRRLRSDLRTFAAVLDADWATPLREDVRWLTDELGSVRDAEVLRDRLSAGVTALPAPDTVAGQKLVAALDADVEAKRKHLLIGFDSDRYVDLIDRLVEAANHPALSDAAPVPARALLGDLIGGPWAGLRKAARALDADSPDDDLHALRIKAKRCRYAAEAVTPVAGKRAAAFAKDVARLQEVLGELHDAVVLGQWLREHAGSGRTAFVAGELCGLQKNAADRARKAWPAVWKQLSRKEMTSWM